MGLTMQQIKDRKPKPVMSDEHKELRGDVENDKPYWSDSYTGEEWRTKTWFEKKGSEADTYGAYVSDLEELVI